MGLFQSKPKPKPVKAKCLGVRATEETKIFATYRDTLYCFLVEYDDGNRQILEYKCDSKEIKELLPLIEM